MNRSTENNGNHMSKLQPSKQLKFHLSCFLLVNFLFCLPFQFFSSTATAQDAGSRAYAIKAGFIYHFTRFVKWPSGSNPDSSNKEYNICVFGDNPFGSILNRLEEKHRFKEHPLNIKLDVSQNDFQGCHILFVSFSERFNVEPIVENARDFPILTIGDTEGFAERGIDINLLVVENRVKLKINKPCLDTKRLKVSSELLDLATLVQGGTCK